MSKMDDLRKPGYNVRSRGFTERVKFVKGQRDYAEAATKKLRGGPKDNMGLGTIGNKKKTQGVPPVEWQDDYNQIKAKTTADRRNKESARKSGPGV